MAFFGPIKRAVVVNACLSWARDALTICRFFVNVTPADTGELTKADHLFKPTWILL